MTERCSHFGRCSAGPGRAGRPNAFTLIELLVVIAIISLLVSILLPSLTRAKDLAKSTVCSANQRNINMGFVYYGQDFEGIIPAAYPNKTDGSGLDFYNVWDVLLGREYLECPFTATPTETDKKSIFFCPADKYTRRDSGSPDWEYTPRSYGMLGWKFPGWGFAYWNWSQYRNSFARPAEVFLVSEWHRPDNTRQGNFGGFIARNHYLYGFDIESGQTAPQWIPSEGDYHGSEGRMNFLFIDGHVESLDESEAEKEHHWLPG